MANYILLERIELNASAASVTFANIPQTGYTDLKVVASARTSSTGSIYEWVYIKFNSSTSGYSYRLLQGNGSSAASYNNTTQYAGDITDGTATASTFGNYEVYIPNYAGSTNKSYSVDAVTENNGTTAVADLVAGLLSNTAAITSINLTPRNGSFVQYSTFSLYGLAATGTSPAIAPKASGGNIIDTDGTYWIHTFTSSGTFTPITPITCDYLVVAGGGGGGWDTGGGGGAGGLRSSVTATGGGGSLPSALSLNNGTAYTVTVGAGGAGATSGLARGSSGIASVFSTVSTVGGGGGGSDGAGTLTDGANGGSGGGMRANRTGTQSTGTTNEGYGGGIAGIGNQAGGGGGAGQVGAGGNASTGGNGGNGIATTISGSSTYYAGGGGGGNATSSPTATGGLGGGGNGGFSTSNATAAEANKGAGGGGGGGSSANKNGGGGGSGIVIIRYPV